jgi:hypothetical protein
MASAESAVPAASAAVGAVGATSAPATPQAAPDTAGITKAYAAAAPAPTPAPAASDRPFFHALFQDTDRPAPIGSAISSLWTTPLASTAADSGASRQSGGMADLFKDTGQSS